MRNVDIIKKLMRVSEHGHVNHWSCSSMTMHVQCLAQCLPHNKHSINVPCSFKWQLGLSVMHQLWGGSIGEQRDWGLKDSLGPGQSVRSLNWSENMCYVQEETHAKKCYPWGNWRAWQMNECVGVCQGEFWKWLWFWTWETNFHLTTMKGRATMLGMIILT